MMLESAWNRIRGHPANEEKWWRGALIGAASGAIASWVMSVVGPGLKRLEHEETRRQEREARGEVAAPGKAAEKAFEPIAGAQLSRLEAKTAGEVVHYGYGAAWGAVYGALEPRWNPLGWARGTAFGAALWLGGDELVVSFLKLGPKLKEVPLATHLRGLVAHLAYGATLDGSYRLLSRALP